MVYLNISLQTFDILNVIIIKYLITIPAATQVVYKFAFCRKHITMTLTSPLVLKVGQIQKIINIKTACQNRYFDKEIYVKIQQKKRFEA